MCRNKQRTFRCKVEWENTIEERVERSLSDTENQEADVDKKNLSIVHVNIDMRTEEEKAWEEALCESYALFSTSSSQLVNISSVGMSLTDKLKRS